MFSLEFYVESLTYRASDVKEVDSLFLDSKRSVKRLTENKDKYLSSLVCHKQHTKTTNYLSSVTQPSIGSRPHSLYMKYSSLPHLVTPTRSPFICLLIINHTFLLMFLNTFGFGIFLPLCLHLLWNWLLTRNLCLPFRKGCLHITQPSNHSRSDLHPCFL